MPITQAKTARNAVAVARGHDAIGMIAVPVGTGRQSAGHVMTVSAGHVMTVSAGHVMTVSAGHVMTVSAGHVMMVSAGHVMTIAGGRGTGEAAIRVAVNSIARKHRSWI